MSKMYLVTRINAAQISHKPVEVAYIKSREVVDRFIRSERAHNQNWVFEVKEVMVDLADHAGT